MAIYARDRLGFGVEVEGWMACLASLLPSSSFSFDYSCFLLALESSLCVFKFWLCEGVFGRELLRANERMVSCNFSFSLSSLLWPNQRLGGGGLCFIFLFFYCLASKNKLSIKCLSNLVLVVLAKPWVSKWFCWQVGSKRNDFFLSFSFALAGHIKPSGVHLVQFLLLSLCLVEL